jgi:hypothetical protein
VGGGACGLPVPVAHRVLLLGWVWRGWSGLAGYQFQLLIGCSFADGSALALGVRATRSSCSSGCAPFGFRADAVGLAGYQIQLFIGLRSVLRAGGSMRWGGWLPDPVVHRRLLSGPRCHARRSVVILRPSHIDEYGQTRLRCRLARGTADSCRRICQSLTSSMRWPPAGGCRDGAKATPRQGITLVTLVAMREDADVIG